MLLPVLLLTLLVLLLLVFVAAAVVLPGVVQELLSAGGDVNAMGERGNRPLHLAAAAGQQEVGGRSG
jgi:ankyrin repeat protein